MIGGSLAVFLLACVLPLGYMLAVPWRDPRTAWSTDTILGLDARQLGLLHNTSVLGLGTAVLATGIGAPLGVVLARTELRLKSLFRVLLAAPVVLPSYVLALAWLSLGRMAGYLLGSSEQEVISELLHSLSGASLVLGLGLYPISMLAAEAAVRRVEPRLEEAALLVARPHRAFWHVTMRLAAPSIVAAALVIFVLAVSEFGVPGLLRVPVFTTEVFTAFAAFYDFSRATLLALPLLLLVGVAAASAVALVGTRQVATRRGGARPRNSASDSGRAGLMLACVVIALALVLPLATLLREAVALTSWRAVVGDSRAAIVNSLVLASGGATLTIGVAFWLGHARARASGPVGTLVDVACLVLFAAPSTVVGVGLIGVWNRPGAFGVVYGTNLMLLLVSFARFLPLAVLALAATTRQVSHAHEEAAATAGAGWMRTMTSIVAPQMLTGVLATWVLVFVLAFGELGASVLVAPPGEATLPIRIYTLIANAPPSHVAALALLQSAVILAPLAVVALVLSRRERG